MSRPAGRSETDGTAVAWPFRVWLWIEVLFGLAAISAVGFRPDETARGFAWHIQPVVMAAFLGGLYIASAPVLILQATARRWEMIRVLIPTAIAFTTAELLATMLHLDRFSVGTLPFNVWLISYLLPPPIFVGMYVYHQRQSEQRPSTRRLPTGLRKALVGVGALLALDGVVGLVVPRWFTQSFPWTLTPLNARVLCGWLIGLGILMLSIAREDDRDRVRLSAPFLILLLPAVALQVGRFAAQVDFTHPRLWIGVALLSFTAVVGIYLARGSWRASLR
jgi:hypothetical protein